MATVQVTATIELDEGAGSIVNGELTQQATNQINRIMSGFENIEAKVIRLDSEHEMTPAEVKAEDQGEDEEDDLPL